MPSDVTMAEALTDAEREYWDARQMELAELGSSPDPDDPRLAGTYFAARERLRLALADLGKAVRATRLWRALDRCARFVLGGGRQ